MCLWRINTSGILCKSLITWMNYYSFIFIRRSLSCSSHLRQYIWKALRTWCSHVNSQNSSASISKFMANDTVCCAHAWAPKHAYTPTEIPCFRSSIPKDLNTFLYGFGCSYLSVTLLNSHIEVSLRLMFLLYTFWYSKFTFWLFHLFLGPVE